MDISGYRNSSYFLKAIPTSNPNNDVTIYYSSQWDVEESKWIYDDNSETLYWIASENGNNQGLFTATKAGNFKDKTSKGLFIGGNPYDWFKDFFDDTIDASSLLSKINNACPLWDIEFRVTKDEYYDSETNQWIPSVTLIDTEALEWQKIEQSEAILSSLSIYPEGIYGNCYRKDTGESLYDSMIGNDGYSYQYFKDFVRYTDINSLYTTSTGVYALYWAKTANNLCVIQVADANGNMVEQAKYVIDFPSGKMKGSQKYDEQLVIKYALMDSFGGETGYQHLYSVDLDIGMSVNRFENVANRNNLEVISYSVGADRLYFSAVRGTAVENHIVDLITNQTNPLGINRKMVAVYAF